MDMRRVKVLDEEGWFHCFVVCEDHVWAMVELDDGSVTVANTAAMKFLDIPRARAKATEKRGDNCIYRGCPKGKPPCPSCYCCGKWETRL